MTIEKLIFPVYRKYKNNKSFFKILGPESFEELQVVGSRVVLRRIEAKLYPEKLFIRELLHHYHGRAEEISEQEYLALKARAAPR